MSFFYTQIKRRLLLIGHNSLCNKCKDRTPHFGSLYFVLCWRCTGVVVGALLSYSLLFYSNSIDIHFSFRILLVLPLVVDGLLSYLTKFYKSNNVNRFITGLLAGFAVTY